MSEAMISPYRLTFCVPGIPAAKPRQTQRDKWHPSRAVQHYYAWADKVRLAANPNFAGGPWSGPVALGLVFCMPIPASWSRQATDAALSGRLAHQTKPDLDNLTKAVKDALQGVAYINDTQVFGYLEPFAKVYAADDAIGAWITLELHEADVRPVYQQLALNHVQECKERARA